MSKLIFVTGSAGFIGFHLSKSLLEKGYDVVGYDNLNKYYDPSLKENRLRILKEFSRFFFIKGNLEDRSVLENIFRNYNFDTVISLAAQAGVRYSIENPYCYIDSNIVGFLNILEACRHNNISHLIFASSSSVYGANTSMPFSVHDNVDHPISLYAATKKANELMAHTYASLYQLPCTGLRFFTVYGPYGRPDMALFKFTKAIINDEPIQLFNNGNMIRDFTYVDDIVEGIFRLVGRRPEPNQDWNRNKPDPGTSFAPYKIYNIGNHNPVKLGHFIEVLEEKIGKKAVKEYLPMQPGDVPETYADVDDLMKDVDFKPDTPIEEGIDHFVNWYKSYYKIA